MAGSVALAQNNDREWISFDNSPPDTPPTIKLGTGSDLEHAVFEVDIHGLWLQPKTDPNTGAQFMKVSLPGGGTATNALGWPELPSVPLNLAIPTRNADFAFEIEVGNQAVLDNIRISPAQSQEGVDESGADEDNTFYFDEAFYQNTDYPWPQGAGRPLGGTHSNRGIPTQAVGMQCLKAIPATKQLIVNTKFKFVARYPGQPIEPVSMTRRFAAQFDLHYDNAPTWWELQLAMLNWGATEGCYLIVTAQKYINELMPLIEQKTERGLRVTIVTTESLGAGFDHDDVKDAISEWYDDCDCLFEAYVLLIGDVDEMPMHVDPANSLPSDHYYVCLVDEVYPSCEIGRFSVDSEEDLDEQITKTMTYSESPFLVSPHYERSLLAAHKQESKGYVECIEDIAAASYWGYSPAFTLYSGREADSLVSNVVADINDTHYGLVMYRGHGWKLKWGDNWNIYNEELWDTDVAALTNGRYTPIVVSVACGNNAIDLEDDSISEAWMEGTENGAVAHIGSIRSSYTTPNHEFAKTFQNYYWSGFNLCVSEMMQDSWLTARMLVADPADAEKNLYMSQLLGDPELRPWRQSPWQIVLVGVPDFIQPGPQVIDLDLGIDGESKDSNHDLLVSATINGELVDLARADDDGSVSLEFDMANEGKLVIRAFSELGTGADGRYEVPVDQDDCPADLDGDGEVEIDDLLAVIAAWNTADADITGDNTTNIDDLLAVLAAYGNCL